MNIWIKTEIYTQAEQKILIQPTPEFDGITAHIKELDGSEGLGEFYITPEELPIIIKKLQEMMEYVTNSAKNS
jgi:hypothetical protein